MVVGLNVNCMIKWVVIICLISVSFEGIGQLFNNGSERSFKQSLDSTYVDYWSNNEWRGNFIFSYSYDVRGNMLERINMSWFDFENNWKPSSKYKYTYDYYGNNIDYTILNWDTAIDNWKENIKWAKVYNSNNQIKQYIEYRQGISANGWTKLSKVNYSYDMNGVLENVVVSLWDSVANVWNPVEKTENIINSNYKVETSKVYDRDEVLNLWVEVQKTENSYDGNQNIVESKIYIWNNSSNSWKLDMTIGYLYNSQGLLVEYTTVSMSNWFRTLKIEYLFDSSNNIIQENTLSIDTINNVWENQSRRFYNYNDTYTRDELILPYDLRKSRYMNHMMTETISFVWNKSNSNWNKYDRTNHIFSEKNINSIINLKYWQPRIYPIPVKDVLYLDLGNRFENIWINIYDIRGALVKTKVLSGSLQLDLNNLGKGVYFYTIEIGGDFYNGKFLKE